MTRRASKSASGRSRRGGAPAAPQRRQRSDDANAFIPDPEGGPAHTRDDLAESLAEAYRVLNRKKAYRPPGARKDEQPVAGRRAIGYPGGVADSTSAR